MSPVTVLSIGQIEAGKAGEGGVSKDTILMGHDSQITNADFMAAVFPLLPEGAFAAMCSKSGDPGLGGSAGALRHLHEQLHRENLDDGHHCPGGSREDEKLCGVSAAEISERDLLGSDYAFVVLPFQAHPRTAREGRCQDSHADGELTPAKLNRSWVANDPVKVK